MRACRYKFDTIHRQNTSCQRKNISKTRLRLTWTQRSGSDPDSDVYATRRGRRFVVDLDAGAGMFLSAALPRMGVLFRHYGRASVCGAHGGLRLAGRRNFPGADGLCLDLQRRMAHRFGPR